MRSVVLASITLGLVAAMPAFAVAGLAAVVVSRYREPNRVVVLEPRRCAAR